jgi:uncharacterized iron-regulated membrane protein
MSVDRLPGLVLPVVFLLAAVGDACYLWWERRRLSASARQREVRREEASRTNRPDRP